MLMIVKSLQQARVANDRDLARVKLAKKMKEDQLRSEMQRLEDEKKEKRRQTKSQVCN